MYAEEVFVYLSEVGVCVCACIQDLVVPDTMYTHRLTRPGEQLVLQFCFIYY